MMTRAEAVLRYLGALHAMLNVKEVGDDNHGQMVAMFLKTVGLSEGYPWCAALQSHVGKYALTDSTTMKSVWPLPLSGGCSVLADFAKTKGILHETPQVGDLMVFWEHIASEKRWRFGHVGGVVRVNADGTVETIEGNTNDDGSRNGWGVLPKHRKYIGTEHRFIRWADLIAA